MQFSVQLNVSWRLEFIRVNCSSMLKLIGYDNINEYKYIVHSLVKDKEGGFISFLFDILACSGTL